MKASNVAWIGNIPDDWKIRSLSQVVSQVKNKNKDLLETNLLSLSYGKIKRKDINNNDGLLPASFDNYNIIIEGDIVLRLTDLQNDHTSLRVGRATEKGIITSAYTTVRPDPRLSKYLYYLLHAFDIKKGFYGMGSGVRQGLTYDEVKTLNVVIPPYDEAASIASYLDNLCQEVDATIDEARANIDDYRILKQSIVSRAVTRGIDSSKEMKESGIPELGLIPATYRIASVRWLISLLTDYTANGSFGDLAKNIEYLDRPDYARLVRLTDLRVNFENEGVYVNEHAYNYLKKSSLYGGEILLANVGAYAGLAVEMPTVDFRATLGPNMFLVKTDPAKWDQHFAYYSLNGDYSKNQLVMRANNTTAQPKLNKDNFKDTQVVLPPLDEQVTIAKHLDSICPQINQMITEKEKLIKDLEDYKRSIIYEIVTGKKKVVQ